jgi:hypothetical protein
MTGMTSLELTVFLQSQSEHSLDAYHPLFFQIPAQLARSPKITQRPSQ